MAQQATIGAIEVDHLSLQAYQRIVSLQETLDTRYHNVDQKLNEYATLAVTSSALTDQQIKDHQAVADEIGARYNKASGDTFALLATFPQSVRERAEGTAAAAASSSAPPPSESDKSPRANSVLCPETLHVDCDPLVSESWFAQFRAFYTSSFLDKASISEQQAYLRRFLDSSLNAILDANTTDTTPVYGSAQRQGCVEVLRDNFSSAHPVFAQRLQLFDSFQGQQSFAEFCANLQRRARIAKIPSMTADELIVHLLIKGAKPELRARFLKLEEPDLASLSKEAKLWQAQKTIENSLAGPKQNVNAVNAVSSNKTDNWAFPPITSKKELIDKGITCFCCGSKQHHTHKCDVDRNQLSCTHCQRTGHTRSVCMGNRRQVSSGGGGGLQ